MDGDNRLIIQNKKPECIDIALPEGVSREMLYPSFWTDNSQILLREEEIKRINKLNRQEMLFDRDKIWQSIGKGLEMLKKQIYADGRNMSDGERKAILKNTAVPFVKEKPIVQYAIAVCRSEIKYLPCEHFISNSRTQRYCDDNLQTELLPFEVLKIYHYSLDRRWCFVSLGEICGWTKCDDLVLVGSDYVENVLSEKEYLTVIGRNIQLCESASHRKSDRLVLPMGTRIPMFGKALDNVDGRSSYFSYIADIPVRESFYRIAYQCCAIPCSDEIIPGVLPLTSYNILTLAFRHLGCIYGWGGAFSSTDCSGLVRVIFKCFGLELPRNSESIAKIKGLKTIDTSSLSRKDKTALLNDIPCGSILYFPGHIMLYLGNHKGEYYVISSCGSISSLCGELLISNSVNCVMINPLSVYRKNGISWLDSLSFIISFPLR